MGQQISVEDALAAFREQYGKVADENVLLRAQASQLERRVKELEDAAQQPAAGGPDLAAQPPYTEVERG
jgi:phage shock protein A